ncbi:hypothetical protein QBC44DRAFT_306705 [Cladorrhinum sp. PSN332]|nr:hypothetical protein QBC44DRAFT_306705 [Cladorrhinum sp. PSN332]
MHLITSTSRWNGLGYLEDWMHWLGDVGLRKATGCQFETTREFRTALKDGEGQLADSVIRSQWGNPRVLPAEFSRGKVVRSFNQKAANQHLDISLSDAQNFIRKQPINSKKTMVVDKERNITYVFAVASVATSAGANATAQAVMRARSAVKLRATMADANAPAEAAMRIRSAIKLRATKIITATKGTTIPVTVTTGAVAVQFERAAANERIVVRSFPKKVAGKSQEQPPPPHRGHRRCSICFDHTNFEMLALFVESSL